MGLKLASTLALTALFALMYALIFVIGVWFLPAGLIGLLIMIGLTLGIVLLQYGISPYIIQWIYRIEWVSYEEYQGRYPHLADIVDRVVQINGIKPPRLGIIHDKNPNAFTFGHTKNNARVVLTEGILEYLNKDEQSAVLAHELGHVIHSDFILMTVVFAIPLVFLTIGRWAYYTARFSGARSRRDEEGNYIALLLFVVAVLSYIAYYIGFLISLIISRIREYYADEHAAEVLENPNPLATGLVKIAYGLVAQTGGSLKERKTAKTRALRGMGIFDPSKAKGLALTSMNSSGGYSMDVIQAAAAWDLFNPWAKYYQAFSTHPLPAKRIQRLNKQCEIFGKTPEIDLSKAKEIKEKQAGKSMLDEFLVDVTMKNLPLIVLILMAIFSVLWLFGTFNFLGLTFLSDAISIKWFTLLWFGAFYLIGFAFIIKTGFTYKKGYEPKTIVDLVTNVKVSPVRCVPAIIEGKIVGQGIPGYYFSEDLYFQDQTGLMYIDYRFGFRIADLIFALSKAKRLVGQSVRIKGWYRRGPSPYFQVNTIETVNGKRYKNYARHFTYIWAVLAFLVGALLFYVGFFVL
ncbi:MAG: M48 family metalloprotease [Candidatus Lokiarchaeota archaeon]|nr:M48 family metalloprotease [Candidatus Lokiarchaeota archaeon]